MQLPAKKKIICSTSCILPNTHFQTGFRPDSDRFQRIDFRENGLKNGLNVSDRFKTERKSAINIYLQTGILMRVSIIVIGFFYMFIIYVYNVSSARVSHGVDRD